MNTLNTHQLNIFLAAAETLNFTLAAQRLQVTQPSVSQQIQGLEEHFGVPLFMRSGRGIELTEAGMALVPLAREMVELSVHVEETMASLNGELHGHLVIGCSTSTGRYILPRLLAAFHNNFAQVQATCHVGEHTEVLQMLAEGKIHLAFMSSPSAMQGIEFVPITQEEIFLIVSPDHPWALREQVEMEELSQANFILPEEGSEMHATIHEALSKCNYSIYQLHPLISVGSLEAIALSVQEGLGVGFVPELVVRRLVKHRVVPVPVRGMCIYRDVFVGRNLRRPATAVQQAFWEFIRDPNNSVIQSLALRGPTLAHGTSSPE